MNEPTERVQKKTLAKRILKLRGIQATSLEYTQVMEDLMNLSLVELKENRNNLMEPGKLNFHERYYDKKIQKEILKVPNGYIYSDYDSTNATFYNSIFVPR